MAQKKRRLGRGLSSLMEPPKPVEVEPTTNDARSAPAPDTTAGQNQSKTKQMAPKSVDPQTGGGGVAVHEVEVGLIDPSRFQPRRVFDESSIEQLASSIKRSGLMQPVIVRSAGDRFELVAGERRWRAAKAAGLDRIPALVRDLDDELAAEWGLVENIQREDLNPMERAHGLRSLSERFGLGHAELGERLGIDRSTVANLIRLTDLEKKIQDRVSAGELSMGHARALLGAPSGEVRMRLAERVIAQDLSVRATEAACRDAANEGGGGGGDAAQPTNATQTQRQAVVADIEKRISSALGTKASVRMGAKGNRGRLVLEFYDLEHFEDLMRRMGVGDTEE